MYRWDLIEQIPASLNALETGNLNIFQPLLGAYVENLLDTSFSDGMNLSVECHDGNPDISREEYLAEVAKFPRVQAFVKSLWDHSPCKIWDSGHANKSFYEPVKSSIPTLFLSGKYDPVTPSFWAHDTARYFSEAYLLLFPGVGHGVFDSDVCAATITQQFLQTPYNSPMDPCLGYRRDPDFMVQLDDMYLIY
jgi:pimeloyl-ACP methyl ester carboxylesterase